MKLVPEGTGLDEIQSQEGEEDMSDDELVDLTNVSILILPNILLTHLRLNVY